MAAKKASQKPAAKATRTPLENVSGIGESTADTLRDAGFKTAEALAKADPKKLSELDGIGEATAKKFIDAAKTTKPRPSRKAVTVKRGKKGSSRAKKDDAPVFNVRDHALVPNHEVLSEEEVTQLFEGKSIQPTNLPTIYISDAALKGLEVKMGDVIRITRESRTSEHSIFYRRVAYE